MLDESSIFAQIDAFIQRCKDLLEVVEGQVRTWKMTILQYMIILLNYIVDKKIAKSPNFVPKFELGWEIP